MLDFNDEKLKNGYIRLYRSIVNWEWFTDVNVCHLFVYCLLKANHTNKNWQGIDIQRGSFITSLQNISKDTGLTVMQVRTALKKLNLTNEITSKGTSRNTVIIVNNYELFQDINKLNNKQITNEQQADNKQITTTNNVNNDNNVNNEEVEEPATPSSDLSDYQEDLKNWHGEYMNVHLTEKQFGNLLAITMSKEAVKLVIDQLSENIASKHEKAKPYDENFPEMHLIACKKYWQFYKMHPEKFKERQQQTEQKKDWSAEDLLTAKQYEGTEGWTL